MCKKCRTFAQCKRAKINFRQVSEHTEPKVN